jgi:acyl dehydratase
VNDLLHFEDFRIGQIFNAGPYEVTKEEIFEFAREFDPQPHHLDEEAAKHSILGGLSASGWHISSIAMRMFCDAVLSRAVGQGAPGVEDCRWMKPVRPGDVLRLEIEIVETRASKSRADIGFVKLHWRLYNQREQVAFFISSPMFARREAADVV